MAPESQLTTSNIPARCLSQWEENQISQQAMAAAMILTGSELLRIVVPYRTQHHPIGESSVRERNR